MIDNYTDILINNFYFSQYYTLIQYSHKNT